MTTTYFISGHIDLSQCDFEKYYIPLIDEAINSQGNFVVGDAMGVDLMAQQYLQMKEIPNESVTIYNIGNRPYNKNPCGYPCIGYFPNHTKKDSAMTDASDVDIAYIRTIEEQKEIYGDGYRVSGTEKNLIRRLKK